MLFSLIHGPLLSSFHNNFYHGLKCDRTIVAHCNSNSERQFKISTFHIIQKYKIYLQRLTRGVMPLLTVLEFPSRSTSWAPPSGCTGGAPPLRRGGPRSLARLQTTASGHLGSPELLLRTFCCAPVGLAPTSFTTYFWQLFRSPQEVSESWPVSYACQRHRSPHE